MTLPPALIDFGRVTLVMVAFFGLSVFMAMYFNTDFKQGYKTKFRSDLKKAIAHSQPTWDQVLLLARSHRLTKAQAYIEAVALLRDVLTGDDKELQSHRKLIEDYLTAYAVTDPYDGLPNETRLHLNRLRDALADKNHLLEPLTIQLKELVSVYERKQRTQRFYTAWGFVLAVLSLAFAGYTYVYPPAPLETSSPKTGAAK